MGGRGAPLPACPGTVPRAPTPWITALPACDQGRVILLSHPYRP